MSQRQDIPFGPLDVSQPRGAPGGAPGRLHTLANLTWAGPPGGTPHLTPPEGAVDPLPAQTRLPGPVLSLGVQHRDSFGDHADLNDDPNQSLNRLVALCASGVWVVDPGQGHRAKEVYAFAGDPDDTRRAQFAHLGDATWIVVSRGEEQRTSGTVIELRGDACMKLVPPPLPPVDITEATGGDLEKGDYVFRFAWQFENGLVAAPGRPVQKSLDSGNSYDLTFTIGERARALPAEWKERLGAVLVYAQSKTLTDADGNPVVGAENEALYNPAFRVARIPGIEQDERVTWGGPASEIVTGEQLGGETLLQHKIRAGAVFSYNKRLMLGGVAYDLYRPDLQNMFVWEDGTHNSDGNDYWLRLRVQIETAGRTLYRWSEPLPYDSSSSESVELVQDLLYYLDVRAESWELLVSTNYTSDAPGSATWQRVFVQGVTRDFEEGGGNYVFRPLMGPIDVTNSGADEGSSSNNYNRADMTGDGKALVGLTADDDTGSQSEQDPSGGGFQTAYFDFASPLAAGTDVTVSARCFASVQGWQANSLAEIEIRLLDEDENELRSEIRSASASNRDTDDQSGQTDGGPFERVFSDAENAARLEVKTAAEVDVDYGGTEEKTSRGSARTSIEDFSTSTSSSSAGGEPDLVVTQRTVESQNATDDQDPTRLLVSGTYLPRELLARRAAYVGEGPQDGIVGFAAATLPVSEGQFGSYPVYALGRDNVHAGEVGSGDVAFAGWKKVAPKGCVGRAAFTNAEDSIVFAAPDGVWVLSPQLSDRALSRPLHGKEGDFLSALGAGTALGFYDDNRAEGRREVWVANGRVTFGYAMDYGRWFLLDRTRRDFARLRSRLYGVPEAQGGAKLFQEGEDDKAAQDYLIVTGLMHLGGAVGTWKRVRRLWVRQMPGGSGQLDWTLYDVGQEGARVAVASGTQATTDDRDTARLPAGLVLAGSLQLRGQAAPGERIMQVGMEYDLRMRRRAPELPLLKDRADWSAEEGIVFPALSS